MNNLEDTTTEVATELQVPVVVDENGNVDVANNPSKVWWKSKTIWFNILFTLLTIASNTLPSLQAQLHISSDMYAIISAFVNIGLRTVSTTQIKTK